MKIQDYRNTYQEFSGLTSTISRQLAYIGIALVWIFKVTENNIHSLPEELFIPITILISALIIDLLQYITASLIWYMFYRFHEIKNIPEDEDIKSSEWFVYILNTFFMTKIILICLAYYYLFNYAYSNMKFI
jgi:hypothetical protein